MSNKIRFVELQELCNSITDCHHSTPLYIESGKIVIRNFNIKKGRLQLDDISYTDEENYLLRTSRAIPEVGDLIITREAPMGEVCIIPENLECCLGQRMVLLKPNHNKVDSNYLLYTLMSQYVQTQISKSEGTGSIVSNLRIPVLKELHIPIYDIERQVTIGKILSDIDSKIALNNRINAELEAMAKTVYDYWFVQFDFPTPSPSGRAGEGSPYKSSGGKMVWCEELKREVPEGWEVKNLGSLGNFKNGVNYDPSNPGDVACPIINVRNISASSYFLKNEDLDVIYLKASDVRKYAVHEGSIIIARSGIPGATRLISDIASNTLYCGFAIHYELEDLSLKTPIFFFLKSIEQQIQNGSGGTIMKNVNQGTLNALQIALPTNNEIISEFNKIIDPIFGKINQIQQENQQLSSLRDWLLPMLMNGQVKVSEL